MSAAVPVGIDLGTTFSVVAYLDAQGRPCTIRNAEGDTITPSVVFFDRSGMVVGREAVKAAEIEPDRVAAWAKRDVGHSSYSRPIRGRQLPPEVVEACVLRKLRADAELVLGQCRQAVITVPAYFNEPRRKATQDAGRLAGLEVLDIINEPTAAAIAFGVQQGFLSHQGESRQTERLLVYDLGGGTFDVTLMEIDGRNYRALATGGDVYLGGIDWDRRIVDHLAECFLDQHGGDDPRDDEATLARWMHEAESAKRSLSARDEIQISVDFDGLRLRQPLSRATFEQLTADLVERTRFTTAKVLKEGGSQWSDLTRLLVVGGSSRMPMVLQMLQRESGRAVDRSLSADEAVAHGAAVFANLVLHPGQDRATLAVDRVTNVNSHDLGVLGIEPGTGRPRSKVLIPRNTALPATRSSRFVTREANQANVVVKVVEGGDASGRNATLIGKCLVSDLPPGLPAKTAVEVAFSYMPNGRLTVEARLPDTGNQVSLTIERASGMSDDLLTQWQEQLDQGLPWSEEDQAEEDELDGVIEAEEYVDDEPGDEEDFEEVEDEEIAPVIALAEGADPPVKPSPAPRAAQPVPPVAAPQPQKSAQKPAAEVKPVGSPAPAKKTPSPAPGQQPKAPATEAFPFLPPADDTDKPAVGEDDDDLHDFLQGLK